MKSLIGIFLLTLVMTFSKAQTMPEAFLSLLPDPPQNVCSENRNGESEFINTITEVSSQLNDEIDRRKEEIEERMEGNKDKMMQNVMARTGVSPELVQQMMALEKASEGATGDQKKANDAKEKAMADQMMQQSMNISMEEIDALKKMDKAGQAAWATGYATEKKAEVMADPQAYQQKAAADMKDFKLLQKQKQLADSLGAQLTKYMKQFEDLDKDQAALAMQKQIDELEKKLNEEYEKTRSNDNAIKSLSNEIRNLQISYCLMQSPKYLNILSKYKSFTEASITPFYRLEKLTHQVNASQTGVEIDIQPGLMGLEQVKAYLNRLSDAYHYNHISPKYTYIGAE